MRDQLRLGLWINDIDAPLKRAISQAAALGFAGVELSSDHPEIHPDTFSESGRRHLARLVRNAGLSLVSIAARIESAHADQIVAMASTAMQMAREMNVRLATLHADVRELGIEVASGESPPGLPSLLGALADVSDRIGVKLAVRGGGVAFALFSDLVRRIDCPTLRIAFDPVDLLLAGDDPIAGLEHVSNQLEIAYIRDASPQREDRGGYICDIGVGGLELDRYLADVSQCVPFERIVLRGPRERRRISEIESDISRLSRTELLRGRE